MKEELEVIGILIGIVNGTYANITDTLKQDVQDVLDLLVKGDVSYALECVNTLKHRYLPNCLGCSSPCGNTSAVIEFADAQIQKYIELKQNYNHDMDILELFQAIANIQGA